MSDSTDNRRHRGSRGSLLDHASDARPLTGERPVEPVRRNQPTSGAAPSILSASTRSARVSTMGFAGSRDSVPRPKAESLLASAPADRLAPASPVGHVTSPSVPPHSTQKQAMPASAGHQGFGDRIARLIGSMTPDERPDQLHPESQDQAPAELAERHQAPAQPYPSSQHSAEPERPSASYDSPKVERSPGDDAYRRGNHSQNHDHWHPASEPSRFANETRPLLDASILISAVWRFRLLICAFTVAGAVLGVIFALSTPHKYYAESRLFVDPREIRVTDEDIRNSQLSTEAMLAITDSQLQILSSTSVLEKVVGDLGLDRDPEFNGSLSSTGISSGLSLIRQIFTGKNAVDENEQKALNKLRDSLSVFRDAKTFVIIVGVRTRDAEKSALISNRIVETYLDSEGQAQSSLLERTSESIDTRINSLRSDLDAAEREVERFKAENGLVGVGGQYIDDKVILALSDQLGNARAMKVGIRVKAENLAKVNIDDVLSGAFPEELLSSNLGELRKQYTQNKSNAESLATRLGPRHPQYIAALQSLETITNEISAELRRIVASSQTELQRAVETEQELASQMATAKSRAMDQSVELVTLRELERKATATRGIYEAFLTRSRETSERSNLSTRNVRVISPAEAPIQANGPSRKIIAIAGMMAGFFAGLGLALLIGAIDSIRAYNGAQFQSRYPGSPTGGYPQPPLPGPPLPGPPHPGPGTPPGGSGHHHRSRRNDGMVAHDSAVADTAAQSYSAARAHFAENHGNESSAIPETVRIKPAIVNTTPPEPVRTGFLRPKWARRDGFADTGSTARSAETRHKPTAADEPPRTHMAEQGPATGRNAQAFMSGHAQQQSPLPDTAPVAGLTPAPAAAPLGTMDQRAAQPAWSAYPAPLPQQAPYQQHLHPQVQPYFPAHPQMMQQPSFHPAQRPYLPHNHPSHSSYMVDPYALVHPGSPNYPDPQSAQYTAPYAAAPVYAAPQPPIMQPQMIQAQMMQPQLMQAEPHPVPPQAYQPLHQPMPSQAQFSAAPAAAPAAQPHATPAPQTVSAAQPARQEPPSSPASNERVDQIRREMDQLRSRIDGYGSERRRA
ncbi:MAG: Wzz/FepE/Etk N-terminal domain-containing protein [Hoeflea sp.]|uniref:GumC family protein n=1 Tax=Hoeflea sp. TaxID=1940281 RepID=UPI003EF1E6AF